MISVGIPTYNRPNLLKKALQKVQQQTYQNLEILVSDNKSPCSEETIRIVKEAISHDSRIKLFHQADNIGSLGNFKFLADKATGNYFIWIADDDEIENTYLEKLYLALQEKPDAVIAMSGYDVNDQLKAPTFVADFSEYVAEIQHPDTFRRLWNYFTQPEYKGRSRLLWGLWRINYLRRAYDESIQAIGQEYTWLDLPLEVRGLSYGDLAVVREKLFRVNLLPTSDGQAHIATNPSKLISLNNRLYKSYGTVILHSKLAPIRRYQLLLLLGVARRWSNTKAFIFYALANRFPNFGRRIKLIWYKVLS